MSYLLYCLLQHTENESPPEPRVCIVAARGLAAVASRIKEPGSAPGVPALLAYEKVVEAIHSRHAVIPLRYGCVMQSKSAIIRLLEEHRQEYESQLRRLSGMTEMGIRVLCPVPPGFPSNVPLPPGAAYLASLRSRYSAESSFAPQESDLADHIAERLSCCYTELRREVSRSNEGRLMTLYFLTPRNCVERFRNRARRLFSHAGARVLLTGPWPPYSFACAE